MNQIIKLTDTLYGAAVPENAVRPKIEGHFLVWTESLHNKAAQVEGAEMCYLKYALDFDVLGEVTAESISFDPSDYVSPCGFHYFEDYRLADPTMGLLASTHESFRSLLSSKGIHFTNPLPAPETGREKLFHTLDTSVKSIMYHEDLHKRLQAWNAAQSKVIDKLIILKTTKP